MSEQQRKSREESGFAPCTNALERAVRIQERAAALNFDWPDAEGALAKLEEEVAELRALLAAPPADGEELRATLREEIGDLLFAAVNVARLSNAAPEEALSFASTKFARRFDAVLERARLLGVEPRESSLEELDELWNEVKRAEAAQRTEES